jgi:hypothetical protein
MTSIENAQEIAPVSVPDGVLARIKSLWPLMGIGLGLVLTVAWTAGLLGLFVLVVFADG